MNTAKRCRLVLLPLILVAAAAVTAACGGGGDGGSSTAPSPKIAAKANGASPTVGAGGAAVVAAAEIDQDNMTFIPGKVSVKAGETVLIKNSESVIHTANINGKNISGNMKKGDAVPWRAEAPGEYKVTCDYHPQMKATIVVGS